MRPICVACQIEMRWTENGVYVLEMAQSVGGVYKIWMADLCQCPLCSVQVIARFADRPYAEHWQENFASSLKIAYAGIYVYDHEWCNGKNFTEQFMERPARSPIPRERGAFLEFEQR